MCAEPPPFPPKTSLHLPLSKHRHHQRTHALYMRIDGTDPPPPLTFSYHYLTTTRYAQRTQARIGHFVEAQILEAIEVRFFGSLYRLFSLPTTTTTTAQPTIHSPDSVCARDLP